LQDSCKADHRIRKISKARNSDQQKMLLIGKTHHH